MLVPSGPGVAHAPHDDIFAVAVSPDVATDGVVHTLSRGFLMRSTDTGATWRRVVDGLSSRSSLSALAAAPGDSDVVYAAAGDGGVFRSDDRGAAWSPVGTLPDGAEPAALAVGPGTDGAAAPVLVAAAEGGLLRSEDGGASWQQVLEPSTSLAGIAFDPGGDGVWAAAHDGALHSSDDSGRTWTSEEVPGTGHLTSVLVVPGDGDPEVLVGTGEGRVVRVDGSASVEALGDGLPDEPVLGLAATGGDDPVLYASTADTGVHRSGDGGRTWTAAADGLTTDGQRDEPEYADRPDFGPVAVAEVEGGPPVVLVGGFDGLFRSEDGATTWTEVETIPATTVVGLALSPGFAEDGTLLVTTYLNGAHLSRDGGTTWEPSNRGLEEPGQYDGGTDRFARLYGPGFSPEYASDATMYVTRPRALLRSTDRGASWTVLDVPGTTPEDGALHYVMALPEPDVVVLADVKVGLVHRSEDGGRSLATVGDVGSPVLSLAVDPGDPRVLHAGTRAGVATSRDGGATWEAPGSGQAWAVTSLAAGAGPDATVLVAGTPRGAQVSHDAGRTWAAADLGPASGLTVEGAVASPAFAEDGTVLVSVRGVGLFRSTDGARTFAPVAPSLGAEQRIPTSYSKPTSAPIAFSPTFATDRTVVASVGPEVLVSTDGGDTWTAVGIEPATHPPAAVDDPGGGWGRRRIAAAAGAGALLAGGLVAVVVLGRRHRRRRPPDDGSVGEVPSAEV